MSKFRIPLETILKLSVLCLSNNVKQHWGKFQFISFMKIIKDLNPFVQSPEEKASKFWQGQSQSDAIFEADRLFAEKKYLEAYEALNRLKFGNNSEIQWRLSRALYELSFATNYTKSVQHEMILEAYEIIERTLEIDEENPQVQKWYAVLLDARSILQGLEHRVNNSPTVKQHLIRASELNPQDIVVHYMLGRWCYEMSNLSQLQRFIARTLYAEPPRATLGEAYHYLSKAENLQPGKILYNTFLLGKTCMRLGEFYRAKYYLSLVSNLIPKNEEEKKCVLIARKMAKKLKKYQLGREVLFIDQHLD